MKIVGCLRLALLVLLSCGIAAAQATLSSLVANNTSACPAAPPLPAHCRQPFPGQTDSRPQIATPLFNPPAGNVSDEDPHAYLNNGASTRIFATFMLGFCTHGNGQYCHNNVRTGYNSDDAATVAAQAEDLIRRHIDGAILTWEGNGASEDNAALKFQHYVNARHCSGPQKCDPMYMLMLDGPSTSYSVHATGIPGTTGSGCGGRSGADFENCAIAHLRNDMCAMNGTHWGNDAYLKQDGRPVLLVFPAEDVIPASGPAPSWTDVWIHVAEWNRDLPHNCARAPFNDNNGVPLVIFESTPGFAHAASGGSYYWIQPPGTDPAKQFITNIAAAPSTTSETLQHFLEAARKQPARMTWGAAFKGFNSALSTWGAGRVMDQACGQTWIASLNASNVYYAPAALPFLQIITWNDYNEGTEIETGIDNCFSISASLSGSTLNWRLKSSSTFASLSTVSHFEVFDSADGENLHLLGSVPAALSGTWNLAELPAGQHRLFVRMVGKNSILNRISAPVAYAR
jgi:hypothetical protein